MIFWRFLTVSRACFDGLPPLLTIASVTASYSRLLPPGWSSAIRIFKNRFSSFRAGELKDRNVFFLTLPVGGICWWEIVCLCLCCWCCIGCTFVFPKWFLSFWCDSLLVWHWLSDDTGCCSVKADAAQDRHPCPPPTCHLSSFNRALPLCNTLSLLMLKSGEIKLGKLAHFLPTALLLWQIAFHKPVSLSWELDPHHNLAWELSSLNFDFESFMKLLFTEPIYIYKRALHKLKFNIDRCCHSMPQPNMFWNSSNCKRLANQEANFSIKRHCNKEDLLNMWGKP